MKWEAIIYNGQNIMVVETHIPPTCENYSYFRSLVLGIISSHGSTNIRRTDDPTMVYEITNTVSYLEPNGNEVGGRDISGQ